MNKTLSNSVRLRQSVPALTALLVLAAPVAAQWATASRLPKETSLHVVQDNRAALSCVGGGQAMPLPYQAETL